MLKRLVKSGKTVFTTEDLAKILDINNRDYLAVLLSRMVKREELIRIRKGIYIYNNNYNIFELANKIKRPSYVSLEKVLFDNAIIFQDYSHIITSVSNNTYREKIGKNEFIYCKIKDAILFNPVGISTIGVERIASVERAVCDTIYLSKNFYFDNLSNINRTKLLDISQIYNKRVVEEIMNYV